MVNCLCGHSEGIHFHTNRLASCAKVGCNCMSFRPVKPESSSVGSKERVKRIIAGKPTEESDVGSDLLMGTHVRDRST